MELSEKTKVIIRALFSEEDFKLVEELLLECTSNEVSNCGDWSQNDLERIWFSILKLSNGDTNKLLDAAALANTDYRDLFMSAGFGYDLEAHKRWQP